MLLICFARHETPSLLVVPWRNAASRGNTALLRHREVLAQLASRSRPEVGVLTELALLRLLHPLP